MSDSLEQPLTDDSTSVDFDRVLNMGAKTPRGRNTPEERKLRRRVLFRAVLGEIACTFLFIFVVCSTGINQARSAVSYPIVGAFAQGFFAVANIYCFADVSGAHFNPAITFATWVSGKTSNRKFILYLLGQIAGSVLAMLAIIAAFPDGRDWISAIVVRPGPHVNLGHAFFMEVVLTYILNFVVFTVAFSTIPSKKFQVQGEMQKNLTIYATDPSSKAYSAPLAIGFTLGILTLIGGSVSGGAFNPVRAFAPALFANDWQDHWIYWVGDFVGAALAALTQLGFEKAQIKPPQ